MRGSLVPVNHALSKPLLVCGVDKQFFIINAALSSTLLFASHLIFPVAFVGPCFFMILHLLLLHVARQEPMLCRLIIRYVHHQWHSHYPAKGSPMNSIHWPRHSMSEVV